MVKRAFIAAVAVAIALAIFLRQAPFGRPKDYGGMVKFGIALQERGEKAKALQVFKDATKAYPGYPQTHFLLGKTYFTMQKESEATEEFMSFMDNMKDASQAMDVNAYIGYLNAIANMCDDMKQYGVMKRSIEKVLALDPKDQSAYYNLGVYYYQAERNRPEAYRNFKKSADLDVNTRIGKKAKYAIEFMRNNPDSRVEPDLSFIDQEYR